MKNCLIGRIIITNLRFIWHSENYTKINLCKENNYFIKKQISKYKKNLTGNLN